MALLFIFDKEFYSGWIMLYCKLVDKPYIDPQDNNRITASKGLSNSNLSNTTSRSFNSLPGTPRASQSPSLFANLRKLATPRSSQSNVVIPLSNSVGGSLNSSTNNFLVNTSNSNSLTSSLEHNEVIESSEGNATTNTNETA